jgi:hypothetical protein
MNLRLLKYSDKTDLISLRTVAEANYGRVRINSQMGGVDLRP